MSRHPVRGTVVAITGAGSGIGRALAVELGRRGASVAVSDVDGAGLEVTATLVAGPVHRAVVDVRDRDAVHAWAAAVRDHFGVVHQVVNNAGIAWHRPVLDSPWHDYERVLAVDLAGVVHGTQAFLPHVIASGDGAVVNVSSVNGLFAQPGISHYCAAKFAVRGFTEALRAEVLLAGHPVRVSLVHPGGVATGISGSGARLAEEHGEDVTAAQRTRDRVYRERLLRLPAADAARTIVDGVERGKPRIRVGRDAVVIDLLTRLAPAAAPRLAVAFERRVFGTSDAAGGPAHPHAGVVRYDRGE